MMNSDNAARPLRHPRRSRAHRSDRLIARIVIALTVWTLAGSGLILAWAAAALLR